MSEQFVSQLCLIGGLVAFGIGLLMTWRRLRQANRVRKKKGVIHAALPEGWGFWFFQGFADVTMGTRWVVAMLILAFWTVLGVGLVSLGLRLAW